MPECHKTNSTKLRDSGPERRSYEICRHCERDLDSDSQEWCRFCAPPETRSRIFQLRLPVLTIGKNKAKHGNVSDYLRGLIARDLDEDTLPEAALKRRRNRGGETDLKQLLEIGKTKSRKGANKNANGSGDYQKIGRIRAAKKASDSR